MYLLIMPKSVLDMLDEADAMFAKIEEEFSSKLSAIEAFQSDSSLSGKAYGSFKEKYETYKSFMSAARYCIQIFSDDSTLLRSELEVFAGADTISEEEFLLKKLQAEQFLDIALTLKVGNTSDADLSVPLHQQQAREASSMLEKIYHYNSASSALYSEVGLGRSLIQAAKSLAEARYIDGAWTTNYESGLESLQEQVLSVAKRRAGLAYRGSWSIYEGGVVDEKQVGELMKLPFEFWTSVEKEAMVKALDSMASNKDAYALERFLSACYVEGKEGVYHLSTVNTTTGTSEVVSFPRYEKKLGDAFEDFSFYYFTGTLSTCTSYGRALASGTTSDTALEDLRVLKDSRMLMDTFLSNIALHASQVWGTSKDFDPQIKVNLVSYADVERGSESNDAVLYIDFEMPSSGLEGNSLIKILSGSNNYASFINEEVERGFKDAQRDPNKPWLDSAKSSVITVLGFIPGVGRVVDGTATLSEVLLAEGRAEEIRLQNEKGEAIININDMKTIMSGSCMDATISLVNGEYVVRPYGFNEVALGEKTGVYNKMYPSASFTPQEVVSAVKDAVMTGTLPEKPEGLSEFFVGESPPG